MPKLKLTNIEKIEIAQTIDKLLKEKVNWTDITRQYPKLSRPYLKKIYNQYKEAIKCQKLNANKN